MTPVLIGTISAKHRATGGGATPSIWNPLDKSSGIVLSNGNLRASSVAGAAGVRATEGKSSGKWMFEISPQQSGSWLIGLATAGASVNGYPGQGSDGYGYHAGNGNLFNGAGGGAYGAPFTSGDIIGVSIDFGTNELVFYKNGASQGVVAVTSRTYFPMVGAASATGVLCDLNAGQSSFAYPITGFSPWTS